MPRNAHMTKVGTQDSDQYATECTNDKARPRLTSPFPLFYISFVSSDSPNSPPYSQTCTCQTSTCSCGKNKKLFQRLIFCLVGWCFRVFLIMTGPEGFSILKCTVELCRPSRLLNNWKCRIHPLLSGFQNPRGWSLNLKGYEGLPFFRSFLRPTLKSLRLPYFGWSLLSPTWKHKVCLFLVTFSWQRGVFGYSFVL